MQILLLSLGGIALLTATWMVAWRVGYSEGRLTVPLRLIRALGQHRVRCEGEDVNRVVADLGNALHLPREEVQRLLETLPAKTEVPSEEAPHSGAAVALRNAS